MKTVCIITGGKSPEHEIAVISARNIYKALDKTAFAPQVLGISRSGQWYHLPEETLFEEGMEIGQSNSHKLLSILPFDAMPLRYFHQPELGFEVDVFFPITHGVYGEDGFLQGVLEYLNKPFVGPGVLGSAIGMDKDVAKSLLQHNGIKVTPWKVFFRGDNIDVFDLEEELGFPMFIKPANSGSGVGVIKAENTKELENGLQEAFTFDIKILVEKGIKGREVETAVLGNLKPEVTGVGEIIVSSGFYTYENKYVNGETQVVIPVQNFSDSSVELLRKTALKAYRCLQLEGMSRVDFFYVSDTEFYLNEVNTLPGFTNISMFPKLWEEAGLNYSNLLTKLIVTAEDRFEMRSELRRDR